MLICGIYKITNRVTGEYYIGQSMQLCNRWGQHILLLHKKKHHSLRFQESFDLHGFPAFVFEVLEIVPRAELEKREAEYIERLKPSLNSPVFVRPPKEPTPDPAVVIVPRRICEKCGEKPCHDRTQRFCPDCRKIVKREMQSSGYFGTRHTFEREGPVRRPYRDADHRERTFDTKFGR